MKEKASPEDLISNYLYDNPGYEEIHDPCITKALDNLNPDEEIWIVQCPKNIDPKILENEKIKLPGRTHQNKIDLVAEEYSEPTNIPIAYKSKHNYNVKNLTIQGRILIKEKLKTIKIELDDDLNFENSSGRVPFPQGLKQRHPLHGVDYEEKIKLSDDIIERLKSSEEKLNNSFRLAKLKKTQIKVEDVKDEPIEDVLYVDTVHNVTSTGGKKKKRKKQKERSDEELEETPRKRKKQVITIEDDVSTDLAWIKEI